MKKLVVAAALLAMTACSSLRTSWDFDPAVNFNQFRTYAWVAKKNDASGYHLDGLMDQRIRGAIEAELRLKGLAKTDDSSADLLVNYLTKVDKKINVDTFNTNFGYHPYWGPGWGWGGNFQTETRVREYKVGTLIIDLVDNKSGKLVWRGSVADTVREQNTPSEREAKVREAVASVLMNFPPKPQAR